MKLDRLLAITILLLNRGRISAKELSDRFEVSTKTIYRDMETINQAGIPIVAHQGAAGGFEIMAQFTIGRQWLSTGEILSMLSAVKGINSAMDDKTFAGLQEKVTALLPKTSSSRGGDSIIFDLTPWGPGGRAREKVNLLRQAIEEKRLVSLQYIKAAGTEHERTVEPYALILKTNLWYLQAYCKSREAFRVFRLSRIQQLNMLPQHFAGREAPHLESYVWESAWSKPERDMVLTFRHEARSRIGDMFAPEQCTLLPDGGVRVEGRFADDEWFYGMSLSFGSSLKVEFSPDVAQEIKIRAQSIVARYSDCT